MNPNNHSRLNFLRNRPFSRRKFVGLGTAAVAGLSGIAAPFFQAPKSSRAAAGNPIPGENLKPGTQAWLPDYIQTDYENSIRAYTSATSVNIGGTLKFYVHVSGGGNYTVNIYRIGWYNGDGGRLLQNLGTFTGFDRASVTPAPNATYGYVECTWPESFTLNVPNDWVSGVYIAKLVRTSNGKDTWVIFVVRDDARQADLLVQASFSTYQAYNPWVMNFSGGKGKSLYSDSSINSQRAYVVSFDRPFFEKGGGDFPYFEYPIIRWLEKEGYDVKYCTNLDVHANPNLPYVAGSNPKVSTVRAFLSIGHDEYWSKEMFDNVQAWRDAGLHAAFFSANSVYWQVRLYPNSSGVPNRRMVCFKDREGPLADPLKDPIANGPIDATEAQRTTRFRDLVAPYTRPENQLIGIMFEDLVGWGNAYPIQFVNTNHWIFKNTNIYSGQRVKGMVGYEWDVRFNNGYEPEGLTELARSYVYATNEGADDAQAAATIYQAKSGAYVFAAGTIYWGNALDFGQFQTRDYRHPGIQQMTRNILNLFINAPTNLLP